MAFNGRHVCARAVEGKSIIPRLTKTVLILNNIHQWQIVILGKSVSIHGCTSVVIFCLSYCGYGSISVVLFVALYICLTPRRPRTLPSRPLTVKYLPCVGVPVPSFPSFACCAS